MKLGQQGEKTCGGEETTYQVSRMYSLFFDVDFLSRYLFLFFSSALSFFLNLRRGKVDGGVDHNYIMVRGGEGVRR